MSEFNAAEFVQTLLLSGLKIYTRDDKLKVDTINGALTDEQRETIREHRDEIIAYIDGKETTKKTVMQQLRERAYDPKATRAVIHMMLYRCQRIMESCPMDSRLQILAKVYPTMTAMWKAQEMRNPTEIANNLELLEQQTIEYVQNARKRQSTVGTG